MSTRASLVYPKDGEGSWGFYHELLDDTVHFEINSAGVSIDMELMPFDQWSALGFPNRLAAPIQSETKSDDITYVGRACACEKAEKIYYLPFCARCGGALSRPAIVSAE